MHLPKSAGTSIRDALEAALPPGALAPQRYDAFAFGGFSSFDRLEERLRAKIAVGAEEVAALADYQVVAGAFPLPVLTRIAPEANIATVLREPRARLLSAYAFLRLSAIMDIWHLWAEEVLEKPTRSLETFLSDPGIARLNDNHLCRLVLSEHPRVRDGDFVEGGNVSHGIAHEALERLNRLGYVGILEQDDIGHDMSRFMGANLPLPRANVSGEGKVRAGALPIPRLDMRKVLDLIEERSAADRVVYETLLARRLSGGHVEARRTADAAFAAQLVRFGDLLGQSATRLSSSNPIPTA